MRRFGSTATASLVAGVLVLAACAQSQDTSPSGSQAPSEAAGSEASPGAGAGAGGAYADTIVAALGGEVGFMSNAATDPATEQITSLIYAGLYAADASMAPVPNLAADMCDVSEDSLTWTCTLRNGLQFHNGEPITAEDVAYTFQLGMSANCSYAPGVCSSLGRVLESASASDERTVVFKLVTPYAPFALYGLARIGIESKAVIEAAFAEFREAAQGATADVLTEQSSQLSAAVAAGDQAACGALVEAVEATVGQLGGPLLGRGAYEVAGGFDECAYIGALHALVQHAATSMTLEGTDAVAAAYPLLGFNRDPVGSGPYTLETYDPGYGVTLTAFAGWWDGEAATRTFNMPIITDVEVAAGALAAGEVDWVSGLSPTSRASLEGVEPITILEYNGGGSFALMYQMHKSIELPDGTKWQGVFYDRALRKAVQYCIDKPALVAAATGLNGVAIETDVPPASWAFNPELSAIERDVEAAVDFIENQATVHTWSRGRDGIYVDEAGERLSAVVYVRTGQTDRIDFMSALAAQVADCGIEILVETQDFQTVVRPSTIWPHVAPGQPEPWQAYFAGFGDSMDPDPSALLHSSQCSTRDQPGGSNFTCFENDEVDLLIESGLRETDADARAEIYRQYQALIQEEQPYLLAWSNVKADAVDGNMAYVDGELPQGTPNWDWQPHKLVIREGTP
ncbi:MAG TPA: ABC transporter substrate-binding protein [Candidatus Limnocylindria bacterium]